MGTRRGDDLRREGRSRQESAPANGRPNGADTTAAPRARAGPGEPLAWYPRFPGDWMRETREQRPEARLAYVELLDAQWDLGDLPREGEALRQLVHGLTRRQWRIAWPFIDSKFP